MSPLCIARDCKKDRSAIRDQSVSPSAPPSGVPHLPQREGGLIARQFRDDAQQLIGIATAGQAPSVAKQSTDRDCKLGWSGTGVPEDPLTVFPLSTPPPVSCSMHQGGALGLSATSSASPFIVYEQERLATNSDMPQWPESSSSAEYDGFDYSHVLHSLPTEMAAAGPSYAVLGGAPPGALSISSGTGVHDAAAAAFPSCSLVSAPTMVWSGLGPLRQTPDGPCVYDGACMGACVSIHTPTAQQQVGSSSIHLQRSLLAATISRQVPLQRPQVSTRNSQAQLLPQQQQQQQQVEMPPPQQPHQQEQQGGLGQPQQSLSMVQQQRQVGPDEQRQNHQHRHHHQQQQQQHKEACETPQPPPQDCSASCNHECTSDSSRVGECPPLSGGLPTAGVTAALAAAGATGTTALVALGAAAVDFAATSALPGVSQAGLATLVVAAAAVDGAGGSTSTGTRS